MRIGIPRESKAGETLVGATPATAALLVKLGYEVVVEADSLDEESQILQNEIAERQAKVANIKEKKKLLAERKLNSSNGKKIPKTEKILLTSI